MFSDLQSTLDPTDGIVTWLSKNDLGDFGEQISTYTTNLNTAATAVAELSDVGITNLSTVADIGTAFSDLQKSVGDATDLFDILTKNTLDGFGEEVKKYVESIKTASDTVSGENAVNEDAITKAKDIGDLLIELQEAIPEEGWFDGKVDLGEFADRIGRFGDAIGSLNEAASKGDLSKTNAVITFANSLKAFTQDMTDADWIRAYNGKGITTNGNMSIGGYIQGNNIINTTFEYQSNRGSVDWRFGAATGTGDENFFGFFDANNRIIPLAIDGNFGNIYVGFNVGGSGSKTAVGIYLGAQVAGNRAFIYHGDSYAGSIWIQTRLDGSWKWFSLGRVCSTALSDIRLKGNIRDTEVENATKVIESMKIHSFERKDSHKKYKIGFIADELEQLDPNLVDGGGEVDGHPYYKSVNNLQMLAYVVKSMQELNQRVSELEKENEKLKRKLKRKLNLN